MCAVCECCQPEDIPVDLAVAGADGDADLPGAGPAVGQPGVPAGEEATDDPAHLAATPHSQRHPRRQVRTFFFCFITCQYAYSVMRFHLLIY